MRMRKRMCVRMCMRMLRVLFFALKWLRQLLGWLHSPKKHRKLVCAEKRTDSDGAEEEHKQQPEEHKLPGAGEVEVVCEEADDEEIENSEVERRSHCIA